jgi:hypothetical protein
MAASCLLMSLSKSCDSDFRKSVSNFMPFFHVCQNFTKGISISSVFLSQFFHSIENSCFNWKVTSASSAVFFDFQLNLTHFFDSCLFFPINVSMDFESISNRFRIVYPYYASYLANEIWAIIVNNFPSTLMLY